MNPAIRCAYTDLLPPTELRPNPLNPNKHGPKQLEMFIAIVGFQGWRRPITVSKRSGFVTKGHGALEAALAAGWSEVPVDYQEYESEHAEKADLVADNQLARMSEMDTGKLQALLVDLNTGDFNMELTGFDVGKLEKMIGTPKKAETLAGGEGAPVVDFSDEEATDNSAPAPKGEGTEPPAEAPPQVRMVQLFFNEKTVAEFMQMIEFFEKEIGTDNVTDTVMEVCRSAFRAHTESTGAQA